MSMKNPKCSLTVNYHNKNPFSKPSELFLIYKVSVEGNCQNCGLPFEWWYIFLHTFHDNYVHS